MANPWEEYAKPAAASSDAPPWEQFGSKPAESSGIPAMAPAPDTPVPKPKAYTDAPQGKSTFGENLAGQLETGLAALTSVPASVIGEAQAAVEHVMGKTKGRYDEPGGEADRNAKDIASRYTFEPRTLKGQESLDKFGKAVESLKLPPAGPLGAEANLATAEVRSQRGAKFTPEATPKPAPAIAEPTYKGVVAGAVEKAKANAKEQNLDWSTLPVKVRKAMVETAKDATDFKNLSPEAKAAQERLGALPVPVKSVTKGQLERDPVQLRMEQQLAQTPQGEKINQVHTAQNKELLDNLEVLAAKPGAKAKSAEQVGGKVDFALRGKEDASKANYTKEYKAAENSVEGRKPASIKPVVDFLNDDLTPMYHGAAEGALSKMKAIKKDAQGNWMPSRDVPLKELEEVRKIVTAEANQGGPAGAAAGRLRSKIDQVFQANEGEKYKQARRSFELHQQQFGETGSVAKIVGDKTRVDRTTALENVYKKTVETGSIQDLRNVRDALLDMETKGTRKQGRKAWRELAGQTVNEIKKASTSNLATDELRNKNFSASGMKSALDKIGDEKLDILLGPGVSKQLRDVLAVAIDIKTSPPKRIQGSDTAVNAMTMANGILDKALSKAGHIPFVGPVAKGGAMMVKGLYDAGKQQERIREAVGEPLTLKKAKRLEQRP